MANKVKVTMTGNSWRTKAGEVREVDSDTAKLLVDNGHAVRTSDAKKSGGSNS